MRLSALNRVMAQVHRGRFDSRVLITNGNGCRLTSVSIQPVAIFDLFPNSDIHV